MGQLTSKLWPFPSYFCPKIALTREKLPMGPQSSLCFWNLWGKGNVNSQLARKESNFFHFCPHPPLVYRVLKFNIPFCTINYIHTCSIIFVLPHFSFVIKVIHLHISALPQLVYLARDVLLTIPIWAIGRITGRESWWNVPTKWELSLGRAKIQREVRRYTWWDQRTCKEFFNYDYDGKNWSPY